MQFFHIYKSFRTLNPLSGTALVTTVSTQVTMQIKITEQVKNSPLSLNFGIVSGKIIHVDDDGDGQTEVLPNVTNGTLSKCIIATKYEPFIVLECN